MLDSQIIVHSNSPCSAPLVPVVKPDGKLCLCVDYQRLNDATPPFQVYIPNLNKSLDKVGNSSILSKLDLVKRFYQVAMRGG